MSTKVKKFWIEKTEFSDLDEGWVEWSDGTKEFVFDVLKDPNEINDLQRRYLKRELKRHTKGLVSIAQLYYLYLGLIGEVLTTDVVEQEAAS